MPELQVNGLRVHYQRLGQRAGQKQRTVVFVHGLIMDNLSSWYFTMANSVAQHADTVLYDLRGHGFSERPAAGYRPQDLVGDLQGLLDGLGVQGPVDLIGNSFGGLLVLAFLRAHPDRVRSAVLVDATMADGNWLADVQRNLQASGWQRDLLVARYFSNWLGRHSERKTRRLARTAEALIQQTSLVEDLGAAPRFSDAELGSIRCPVLALYGANSEIRSQGERLARCVPNCELELFPGCTHSIIWEATASLRERMVAWVSAR